MPNGLEGWLLLRRFFLIVFLAALIGATWYVAYTRIVHVARKDDRKAWAAYNQGIHFLNAGNPHEAKRSFATALDLAVHPAADMYGALADRLSNENRCAEALPYFRKGLELTHDKELWFLLGLAWCYSAVGKPEDAIASLESAQNKHPHDFPPRHREFLESLKADRLRKSLGDAKQRNVEFQGVGLENRLKKDRVWVIGNWTGQGTQSDAYGYRTQIFLSEKKGAGNLATAEISLSVLPDFPYRAVLVSEQEGPIGFARFKLDSSSMGTKRMELRPIRESVFYALKKGPTLQKVRKGSDGKRRLFILWPDCGSWWFLQSLIHRGLAPNAEALTQAGAYGEMISDPPLTGIAIQRLTSFSPTLSFWNTLAIQLKGLEFLDRWIEIRPPQGETLQARLAKHGVSFVNLTFSEPGHIETDNDESAHLGFSPSYYMEAWHKPGEKIFKPDSIIRNYLDVDRLESFVSSQNAYGQLLLATQWEDTEKKVLAAMNLFQSDPQPNVMLLRLPALDLLSHFLFENTDEQSDKNQLLGTFYIYLDDILGRFRALLDEDDTLMLISDHGIRDTIQHHPKSIFAAAGPLFNGFGPVTPFEIQRFPELVSSIVLQRRLPDEFRPLR